MSKSDSLEDENDVLLTVDWQKDVFDNRSSIGRLIWETNSLDDQNEKTRFFERPKQYFTLKIFINPKSFDNNFLKWTH